MSLTTALVEARKKMEDDGWIVNHIKVPSVCPNCGYSGAIMYNPYNNVVQCHNCGQVIPCVIKEKVKFD